ncbi:MAG TPA: lysophospholipid acyltransferase family protein, partial [Spirochaetota bacterium]|nr:lysophospholipid acyltransferase family protein [Spirochaetota bacterium]
KSLLSGRSTMLLSSIFTHYVGHYRFSLILFLKILLMPLIKIYFNLHANGKRNIPEGPVIFAPNHQSFLDSLLLIAALPNKILKNSYFLSRELGLIKISRGDSLARLMNTIIVNIDINLKESIEKMAAVIQHKGNLVIFPEGTRTINGHLLLSKQM